MSMDNSTLFNEGNIFEIYGNIAPTGSSPHSDAEWVAAEYGPPAYVGRIITGKDGFFRGYLLSFMAFKVMGWSGCEDPVVGRFIKGRNEKVHVLFCTIKELGSRCWMKRKLDKKSNGVYSISRNSDKERSQCHLEGFFTFNIIGHYVKNNEDKEALASVITTEYERLLRGSKSLSDKADEFTNWFDSIKENMLDLIDRIEDEEYTISFP